MSVQRALITAGGSGIGLAVLECLLERGARVAVLDLDPASPVPEGVPIRGLDVADVEALEAGVAWGAETLGGLDVLVNVAGIGEAGGVDDVTVERWERTFAVNVRGSFFAIKAARPYLARSDSAAVVNVSSLAGRSYSVFGGPDYSSSKAAVLGLTRHLAALLGPEGIRVNATCPGPTATPATAGFLAEGGAEKVAAAAPLGREGTPREQAETVAFLASPQASYITGAVVDVNGGLFMG
jgi:3-oxoacyl-[acyl-carrier protein] reductase